MFANKWKDSANGQDQGCFADGSTPLFQIMKLSVSS